MISIIIPYFQRTSGVLQRALRSVQRQHGVSSIHVIVVDDGSPISARSEMASLGGAFRVPVTVIEQRNGGPGAARNRGLDSAPNDTKYIAFLDSDDEWSEDHLHHAARALDQGYDCYFANNFQLGQTIGAFERAGRITPRDHPLLFDDAPLRAYSGDMFNQIVTGNVIGTSTIVFNFQKFADVRFRVDFRSAGEDYLFWMTLAARGAKFAFSDKVEAVYGPGVNIFSGAGWGTEGHLGRLRDEARYLKTFKNDFSLTAEQLNFVNKRIRETRFAMVRALLHQISHRRAGSR